MDAEVKEQKRGMSPLQKIIAYVGGGATLTLIYVVFQAGSEVINRWEGYKDWNKKEVLAIVAPAHANLEGQISDLRKDVYSEMDLRGARRDGKQAVIDSRLDRIERNVEWLVINRGGKPAK